jgi:tetratricopeptide (TPR) repeat protein
VAESETNDTSAPPGAQAAGVPLSPTSADEQVLLPQLHRASELVTAQRLPEAETVLMGARRTSPHDLRVLKLLALVRFKLGRLAEAAQVYREAAIVAPEDPAVRLNLGLIALKLESFAEAAQELEAAVRGQPEDRRAWSYLGYAYARNGSPAQAASAFRRAGQHELAAEMERATTGTSHSTEIPVVEGFADAPPERTNGGVSPVSTAATPRPVLRREETPVPSSRMVSGEMVFEQGVTLAAFTTARLLSLPPLVTPIEAHGEGVLRFQAGAETHVRESALLAAAGGQGLALARRRSRGQLVGDQLATDADRFFRVNGGGELLLVSPQRERRLIALALDRDVLYIEEDRVAAWGDEVVWESGKVPGDGKALLQFRGSGRVVILAGEDELIAIRIAENERMAVPAARLAGWLGPVVVQGRPVAVETALDGLEYVTCEGEGVLLLSRHGEHH